MTHYDPATETPSEPKIGHVPIHGLCPEHVKVDSLTSSRGQNFACAALGPVDIYAPSLDHLAAIGEQIVLMARRAKARQLLANAPFRGDAA